MSTTAVPLRPVSKSGIAMLWGGLLALLGGAVAFALFVSNMPGITVVTLQAGTGAFPTDNDVAFVKYEGRLADGTVFDANDNTPLPVGQMIPGFAQGLKQMQVGGRYRLSIPAELAYGEAGGGPIPPNSDLEFDVEVKDIRSQEEMQAMMQQQQMMQQLQQGEGGGDAGGPEGAPPTP